MRILAINGLQFPHLLRQVFELRADIFGDRLGWQVTVTEGQERDQFDQPETVYLVAVTPYHTVVGAVRLLPRPGPMMIDTVFSSLLPDRRRLGRDIVEASRFCTNGQRFRAPLFSAATTSLFAAMIDWSLNHQIAHIAIVVDLKMERLLQRVGWPMKRISSPQKIGPTDAVAGFLPVTRSHLELLASPDYQFADLTGSDPMAQELIQVPASATFAGQICFSME